MANLAVRAEPFAHRMKLDEVGGGRVIRMFRSNGRQVNVGTFLTRDDILAINPANRTSLIGRFIDVWPKAPDTAGSPPPQTEARLDKAERHVVSLGFNRFKVFEGAWLTDDVVSREDAYKLAGKDAPPVQKMKKRGKEH
jgi:hypothetical protein